MPPLFSDSPPHSLSRRAKVSFPSLRPGPLTHLPPKFYGFLSRSNSRSRSGSQSDTRPSDSGSNESPDLKNATTNTSDSHLSTLPPPNTLTSRPRSPSRPLSNNTTTTGETVTPKNMRSLTPRAGRPHRKVQAIPINDSGIGVDEPLITYDPRMPPPPVPCSAPISQPTPIKEKRRSKPLFGLPAAPWARPTTPKDEHVPLPSPQTPRNRSFRVSRIENWFKLGPSFPS